MASSAAVERARSRRVSSAAGKQARVEWFIDEVVQTVQLSMDKRVRLATEFLKSRVVQNISRPVTKTQVVRDVSDPENSGFWIEQSGTVVTNRSKPGEFPKADTTQLMKTIFGEVKKMPNGTIAGFVGTPLDYGLILEVRMNRSFLVRTLIEESDKLRKILAGPLELEFNTGASGS